jgi:hypothetical protein
MLVESVVKQMVGSLELVPTRAFLLATSSANGSSPVTFFSPSGTGMPGIPTIQRLVDTLGYWAMILALVGLVIGAAVWALGAHSQNYNQSVTGRRAVLVSGAAALLIGAAPGIIKFFFNAGRSFS